MQEIENKWLLLMEVGPQENLMSFSYSEKTQKIWKSRPTIFNNVVYKIDQLHGIPQSQSGRQSSNFLIYLWSLVHVSHSVLLIYEFYMVRYVKMNMSRSLHGIHNGTHAWSTLMDDLDRWVACKIDYTPLTLDIIYIYIYILY